MRTDVVHLRIDFERRPEEPTTVVFELYHEVRLVVTEDYAFHFVTSTMAR